MSCCDLEAWCCNSVVGVAAIVVVVVAVVVGECCCGCGADASPSLAALRPGHEV